MAKNIITPTPAKSPRMRGIKTTELVKQAKRLARQPRGKRTFEYPNIKGYFEIGTINGDKFNFTYHTENPSVSTCHVKVRFQVYDNIDKALITATNTEKVVEAYEKALGLRVYFYNEIAKKAAKAQSLTVSAKTNQTFWDRLKAFFRQSA